MSIARGIAKAVKAQSRGLKGKRNHQGDFMPEDVVKADFKEVAGAAEVQKAAVKNFSDEELKQLQAKLTTALDMEWAYQDTPEGVAKVERLKERLSLVEDEIEARRSNAETGITDEPMELPPEDYIY